MSDPYGRRGRISETYKARPPKRYRRKPITAGIKSPDPLTCWLHDYYPKLECPTCIAASEERHDFDT